MSTNEHSHSPAVARRKRAHSCSRCATNRASPTARPTSPHCSPRGSVRRLTSCRARRPHHCVPIAADDPVRASRRPPGKSNPAESRSAHPPDTETHLPSPRPGNPVPHARSQPVSTCRSDKPPRDCGGVYGRVPAARSRTCLVNNLRRVRACGWNPCKRSTVSCIACTLPLVLRSRSLLQTALARARTRFDVTHTRGAGEVCCKARACLWAFILSLSSRGGAEVCEK